MEPLLGPKTEENDQKYDFGRIVFFLPETNGQPPYGGRPIVLLSRSGHFRSPIPKIRTAVPKIQTHVTSPHLTSAHVTSPHLTSAHLSSPQLTSPHLTSPHVTSRHSHSHTPFLEGSVPNAPAPHFHQLCTSQRLKIFFWDPVLTNHCNL